MKHPTTPTPIPTQIPPLAVSLEIFLPTVARGAQKQTSCDGAYSARSMIG